MPFPILDEISTLGLWWMSDKLFLAVKEFKGKLVDDNGSVSEATGDITSLTANSGKDLYLSAAKISARLNDPTAATGRGIAVLLVNGTTTEVATVNYNAQSNIGGGIELIHEFKSMGHKAASGEVIKLLATECTNIDIYGMLLGFEEDTDEDPFNDFR